MANATCRTCDGRGLVSAPLDEPTASIDCPNCHGSGRSERGFDHTDNAALMCAAMVADPEFRERVIRLNFEKALREVRS